MSAPKETHFSEREVSFSRGSYTPTPGTAECGDAVDQRQLTNLWWVANCRRCCSTPAYLRAKSSNPGRKRKAT